MQEKELQRLQAVNRFLKLEISREKELQDIVSLAAAVCETPIAVVTLLGEDSQYFKFRIGIDIEEVSIEQSVCRYIIEASEVTIIPDLSADERFADNPHVAREAGARFYAGASLRTHDGHSLGCLCVVDTAPKQLNVHQIKMLEILSRQVIYIMEFELTLEILKEQFVEAKSSEIKLRSFFESSNAIHILIGRNLELVAFNKVASDFVREFYDVELSTGLKATDHITRAHQLDFVNNYTRALNGESIVVEKRVDYYEKGDRWWSICYNPAFNNEGDIIGVSYTCTDISERKRYEERMRRQNDMLKKIAFMQSHEFRRPVASILGLMNVIKLEGYDADHRESLQMLEAAVVELDEKIHDIVNTIYSPELLPVD